MSKHTHKPFGKIRDSELQPVEANSPRLNKARRSDHTTATDKQILTKLNGLERDIP